MPLDWDIRLYTQIVDQSTVHDVDDVDDVCEAQIPRQMCPHLVHIWPCLSLVSFHQHKLFQICLAKTQIHCLFDSQVSSVIPYLYIYV